MLYEEAATNQPKQQEQGAADPRDDAHARLVAQEERDIKLLNAGTHHHDDAANAKHEELASSGRAYGMAVRLRVSVGHLADWTRSLMLRHAVKELSLAAKVYVAA